MGNFGCITQCSAEVSTLLTVSMIALANSILVHQEVKKPLKTQVSLRYSVKMKKSHNN